ncbi:16S rRNA (cytosine(967)-C(5))-methyltransferase RsmB [Ramlibacter monticola]|uniref:16S rRNA (cytosine(967)-C(5))-methyltransferase n=1 Tax=Ramlibacter monticola TaxID=1926872 RepID=A0A936Z384_9BURK|nr:16S rRNA (cytosine(967)-C(5))-methyltransferase RsmB [Ramlibacter monticola]MBL0392752.1 16S rRNA (cytosine(967)-C(5))-methyltransferase RsmB [Ramlibacter monticola]
MHPPIPLWRQLQAAASVLASVRRGESATPAIARVAPAVRPGAQALAYHVLRQLARADALRRQLAKKAPPPAADALLCTALALASQEEGALYEPFTLVDQAVEAAKRSKDTRPQQAFINACLRRFLREREALLAAIEGDPVARWNHPAWWIALLQRDYPEDWEQVLEVNNTPAPMTLRVNTHKISREPLRELLAAQHIASEPVGRHGLILDRPHAVDAIPGFADGLWSVQDAGAQLAAELLLEPFAPDAPLRILDACAAPGGKTAHLCELARQAHIVALDVDPVRCERIHQNLQRLDLRAEVRTADAGEPSTWWDGKPFDAILLDAPCTASGVVRRHPDVRWLRREADVSQLAAQQERLLTALWPLLKPGGTLVYCTCSVFRAEGDRQVAAFLAHNSTALLRPGPGHFLPRDRSHPEGVRDNEPRDHDGFFYAVVQKSAQHAPAPPEA